MHLGLALILLPSSWPTLLCHGYKMIPSKTSTKVESLRGVNPYTPGWYGLWEMPPGNRTDIPGTSPLRPLAGEQNINPRIPGQLTYTLSTTNAPARVPHQPNILSVCPPAPRHRHVQFRLACISNLGSGEFRNWKMILKTVLKWPKTLKTWDRRLFRCQQRCPMWQRRLIGGTKKGKKC